MYWKKCVNKLDRMNMIDGIQVVRPILLILSIPSNICPFNIEEIQIIRKHNRFGFECACCRLYDFWTEKYFPFQYFIYKRIASILHIFKFVFGVTERFYWKIGHFNKTVTPIQKSLFEIPYDGKIDIAAFIEIIPRNRAEEVDSLDVATWCDIWYELLYSLMKFLTSVNINSA